MSKTTPLIYLLDDDTDFRALLVAILSKLSMRVEAFAKSDDFFRKLKLTAPQLAIVDLNLEGEGTGFDVLKKLAELKLKPFPVLMASADMNPVSIAHALELGASDYVTKPLNRDVLTSKLLNFVSSDRLEEATWSFVKGPESRFSAVVELELEVREVDELGIKIATRHLLSKGTAIQLSGDFFATLFGSEKPKLLNVTSTWIEPVEKLYGSFLEFDSSDEALIQAVRKWISSA